MRRPIKANASRVRPKMIVAKGDWCTFLSRTGKAFHVDRTESTSEITQASAIAKYIALKGILSLPDAANRKNPDIQR